LLLNHTVILLFLMLLIKYNYIANASD